jgi:hypothetical protein
MELGSVHGMSSGWQPGGLKTQDVDLREYDILALKLNMLIRITYNSSRA